MRLACIWDLAFKYVRGPACIKTNELTHPCVKDPACIRSFTLWWLCSVHAALLYVECKRTVVVNWNKCILWQRFASWTVSQWECSCRGMILFVVVAVFPYLCTCCYEWWNIFTGNSMIFHCERVSDWVSEWMKHLYCVGFCSHWLDECKNTRLYVL